MHLTWTYNGAAGKRARLRDMGLWFDPPNYYSSGSFVTVDLDLPEARHQFAVPPPAWLPPLSHFALPADLRAALLLLRKWCCCWHALRGHGMGCMHAPAACLCCQLRH